tara:strand:+ start:2923 stop:4284 length:1362 start_codon:yes stop_codon:yes gene_type:complete
MNDQIKRLQPLAVFIEFEKRLRKCADRSTLAFNLVNETHSLSPYRQAVLWQPQGGLSGRILAVSGLSMPDANAPFSSWARKFANSVHSAQQTSTTALQTVHRITADSVDEEIAREWKNWFPASALWIPIQTPDGELLAALILGRDTPWTDSETALLNYLSDSVSHVWQSLDAKLASRPGRFEKIGNKRRWMIAALAVILVSVIPVRQTTLAPVEIIAKDPVMIRAGIDGVIDTIAVEPNQRVIHGQTLLTLDATRLNNQLEVARKALEVADAEYRQAAQTGVFDNRANANLAILKGRAEQHVAEIRYLESILSRVTVSSPRDGVAVYSDRSEWEGRPVTIGERIMLLADPKMTELEIQLPVADVIALEEGARVRVFLNIHPHTPVEAAVRFANYQADLTPEGTLAYRVVADFSEPNSDRIGLKGTAKLYGNRTLLILYVLRRPLTSLRQMTGF